MCVTRGVCVGGGVGDALYILGLVKCVLGGGDVLYILGLVKSVYVWGGVYYTFSVLCSEAACGLLMDFSFVFLYR